MLTSALCLAISLTVVAAGCGGGGSSSGGTTSGSAGAETVSSDSGGSASSAVAEASKIVKLAETRLLAGPTTGTVTASEIEAPQESDIQVMPYQANGPVKKLAFVVCSPLSAQCMHEGQIGKEFAAKLGIESVIENADYTPAGNQRAMNAALGAQPDAIITLAIAPGTIGPQMAQAKKEGIAVIDGEGSEKTNEAGFDAYVPQSSNLYQIAYAAKVIEESEGKGNIVWLNAHEFPQLEVPSAVKFVESTCSECTITEGSETAAQVTAPVPMGQLITSTVRANSGLEWLVMASACADNSAASAAIRQTGSDVQLGAPGCGAGAIQAMNSSYLPFASGKVEPWGALEGIDQALRLGTGKPALPESEAGPGVYLVTPESTPDTGTSGNYGALDRWTLEKFDYLKPFEKAWGVELKSIIEEEE
jgi:ABC-type sugar transport system substrate-binding protein